MCKKMFFLLAFSAVFSFFFSCSQDIIEPPTETPVKTSIQTRSQSSTPEFEIVNGRLEFQNDSDYTATYNSLLGMNKEELLLWSETNGYSSLLSYYKEGDSILLASFVPDHDYEPGEEFIDTSERVSDPIFATLLNSNGIVLVGDTVFKLRGKYVYKIPDGDTAKADEIDNAADITSLDYIPHFQHTIKLQSRLRNYERSPVILVTSSRREYVEFKNEVSDYGGTGRRFRSWMSGQAQTKSLGMWWPNFDDEIVSGTITNAAYVGETSNSANNSMGNASATAYNIVNIEVPPFVFSILSGYYRFVVNFQFVKDPSKGTESYTNQYYASSY